MVIWPEWWKLELSPHLLKRMLDRRFSEVELRLVMEQATGFQEAPGAGRWIVETVHDDEPWGIIV